MADALTDMVALILLALIHTFITQAPGAQICAPDSHAIFRLKVLAEGPYLDVFGEPGAPGKLGYVSEWRQGSLFYIDDQDFLRADSQGYYLEIPDTGLGAREFTLSLELRKDRHPVYLECFEGNYTVLLPSYSENRQISHDLPEPAVGVLDHSRGVWQLEES